MNPTHIFRTIALSLAILTLGFVWHSQASVPALQPSTVIYLTYSQDGTRRCVGKERIGYRANPACCPTGFHLVGIRVNGDVGDAVCLGR